MLSIQVNEEIDLRLHHNDDSNGSYKTTQKGTTKHNIQETKSKDSQQEADKADLVW